MSHAEIGLWSFPVLLVLIFARVPIGIAMLATMLLLAVTFRKHRERWLTLTSLLVGIISAPLVLAFGLGIVTFFVGIALISVWVIYRVIRGWLALRDGRPMPA